MLQRIRKASDEGFTLIELLIVIIILGILAAIVVFAVGSTRKDSVASTCKTDVQSIRLAEEAYKTKNGVYTTTQSDLTDSTSGFLKSWPGGSAATDNLWLTLGGSTSAPTLLVKGKNFPAAGNSISITDDDGTIETKCTPSG
jgi:general secretion pathway protein G